MKNVWLFVLLLSTAIGLGASAQDDTITLDDAVRSAEEWAKENLDDDALRVLKSVDQEKVKQFLAQDTPSCARLCAVRRCSRQYYG